MAIPLALSIWRVDAPRVADRYPIRYTEQAAALPQIRRDLPHQGRWSATAQQQVLRRLDQSYAAFFGRVKRGAKAGFPRFRARARYHAADVRVATA